MALFYLFPKKKQLKYISVAPRPAFTPCLCSSTPTLLPSGFPLPMQAFPSCISSSLFYTFTKILCAGTASPDLLELFAFLPLLGGVLLSLSSQQIQQRPTAHSPLPLTFLLAAPHGNCGPGPSPGLFPSRFVSFWCCFYEPEARPASPQGALCSIPPVAAELTQLPSAFCLLQPQIFPLVTFAHPPKCPPGSLGAQHNPVGCSGP